MGISIKNDKVEAKIRELAQVTGASVTDAVDVAVGEALVRRKRFSEAEVRARKARIDRITKAAKKLPVYDDRPVDELLDDGSAR
jgi:antitoxin VapB